MEKEEGKNVGGAGGVDGRGGNPAPSTTTTTPPTAPTITTTTTTTTTPTTHTLQENLANLLELKKVHSERLHEIEDDLSKLHSFKKDYEHLYKRLKTLPDKITHEVMVPLGPLALVPGQLVHTNEVLVLLGDNWFAQRSAKQACEIVRRRLKDCEEKIRSAENSRRTHKGWLEEAEELLSGEEGQRVEIIEEMTEEEYRRSQEEHRRRVGAEYTRLKEGAPHQPASSPAPSPQQEPSDDPLMKKMEDGDRRSYEALMQRLDQLEMEEMMGEVMEPLQEEDEEEEEEEDEEDEEGVFNEQAEENNERQNIVEDEEERKIASARHRIRGRLHSAEAGGCVDEGAEDTDDEGESDHSDRTEKKIGLSRKHRLRRRVSWADDVRPLYTIIPDDDSKQVHRIPYTSTPAPAAPAQPLSLPLGAIGGDATKGGEDVQSPSDLYRVFGQAPPTMQPSSAPPDVKEQAKDLLNPRSILKKSKSLPSDDSGDGGGGGGAEDGGEGGGGWCCPPKPLDLEGEEDIPPPPPSPPPRRALSFKPAFSYRVLEHKVASAGLAGADRTPAATTTTTAASTTSTAQPGKKVSRFWSSRHKK